MDPDKARPAAGLLLMFPVDGLARVVLTVRASTLEHHGGQVSLPGGAVEDGESVEQAALREAHEEIGLDTADVRVLGALTPVDVHVSGFRLFPIVGTMADRPALAPHVREVSRVLEVGVGELMDPRVFAWRTLDRAGLRLDVPTVVIEGDGGREELWGATAMVVAEFLTLLGWSGPPLSPGASTRSP
jgi:8-oxo-dGTP pyrophosphatase MutT (NUDIX family)